MKNVKIIRVLKSKVREIKKDEKRNPEIEEPEKNIEEKIESDSFSDRRSGFSEREKMSFKQITEEDSSRRSLREENEEISKSSPIYSGNTHSQEKKEERRYTAPEGVRGNDLQASSENNQTQSQRSMFRQDPLFSQQNKNFFKDSLEDVDRKYDESLKQKDKTKRRYPWEA